MLPVVPHSTRPLVSASVFLVPLVACFTLGCSWWVLVETWTRSWLSRLVFMLQRPLIVFLVLRVLLLINSFRVYQS